MLQIFLRWGIAHCRLLLMQGHPDHRFYEWPLACDGAVYERVAFSENPRRLWPVAGPGGKDENGNERKDQHQRGQRSLLESCFTEDIMHLVMQGKLDEAEECVRHAVGRFGAES